MRRILTIGIIPVLAVSGNPYMDVVVVQPSEATATAMDETMEPQQPSGEVLSPPEKWEQTTQTQAAPRQLAAKEEASNELDKGIQRQSHPDHVKDGKVGKVQSRMIMVAKAPAKRILTAEAEQKRLALLGNDIEIKSRSMPLRSAIAMLVGATEMRAILPPASDKRWDQPVAMRGSYRPKEFLELLQETYGFDANFVNGVYRFQMRDIGEVVTRTYQIRHNNRIKVDIQPSQSSMGMGTQGGYGGYGGYGSMRGTMGSSSMMGSGEQSSNYTPEVSLLVAEVESIIDRPIKVREQNSYIETEVSGGGNVFFVPERNLLVVTCSTEHHKLVNNYISEVDKPQRQVRLDVIFVETSRNPSSELGLDWEGFSGAAIKMDGIEFGPVNWVRPGESQLPLQTFVKMDALQTALHFLAKDEKSSIMSRSDVVVVESEYAEIRGVVAIPVKNTGFAGTGGIGGVLESQVSYQEIGTIVGLVPHIVEGSRGEKGIKVNFSITSSIPAGETQIDGNAFPVIAKREYKYPVVIPDGHALAIGGLAETVATVNNVKVPILGDIPALGYLFKKQSKSKSNRRVIAYIVPRIIERNSSEYHPHEFDPHPSLETTMEEFRKETKTKGEL